MLQENMDYVQIRQKDTIIQRKLEKVKVQYETLAGQLILGLQNVG